MIVGVISVGVMTVGVLSVGVMTLSRLLYLFYIFSLTIHKHLTTFHKWFTVINLVPYLFNRDCRQPVAMSSFPKKTTL